MTQDAPLGRWIRGLSKRTRKNVAMVALAAKLARFAWAVLCKERGFDPAIAAGHANKDNRRSVHSRGIIPVIPHKANDKHKLGFFARTICKGSARIEQAVGKLKRFKHIALLSPQALSK